MGIEKPQIIDPDLPGDEHLSDYDTSLPKLDYYAPKRVYRRCERNLPVKKLDELELCFMFERESAESSRAEFDQETRDLEKKRMRSYRRQARTRVALEKNMPEREDDIEKAVRVYKEWVSRQSHANTSLQKDDDRQLYQCDSESDFESDSEFEREAFEKKKAVEREPGAEKERAAEKKSADEQKKDERNKRVLSRENSEFK